ncbi:MAG: hypothetical protein CL878_07800 [Dehalococcoidia bacterium]|nr:hypothetical protein [Dehalococcoidia bacterium]
MGLDVLLVNANRMKPAVAPIGLAYVAQALDAAGHHVELLDLCFVPDSAGAIGEWFAAGRRGPDLVGVTIRNTDDCYFASQESFIPHYRAVIGELRRHTSAPLVLGGAGFSVMPEGVMQRLGVRLGVAGDGETAAVALANVLEQRKLPDEVPGLIHAVDERGGPLAWPALAPNGARESMALQRNEPAFAPLDDLPVMERRWIDHARYFREGGQAGLETKRGCAMRCTYCVDPIAKGRRYRLRSVDALLVEIEAMLSDGVDTLHLCDAEFNLPRRHALAVCEALIASGLHERVRWYTYASPIPFDYDLALLLRRAGCVGINFGGDAGNPTMLRSLGRVFGVETLVSTAEACRRAGLTFMYDLLLGGPGETRETLRASIELMKRLDPDCVGAAMGVRLYPGTTIGQAVLAAGQSHLDLANPHLHGVLAGNDDLVEPVFYLSAALGNQAIDLDDQPATSEADGRRLAAETAEAAVDYLRVLVAGDSRFFAGGRKGETGANYNYNDNSELVQAIRRGARGAYWDILRKLRSDATSERLS